MKKQLVCYIVTCLICFFVNAPHQLLAQNPGLGFKHLNARHGLSNDGVRSIYQDEKGFMWFATERGVDRYDGKEFRNYLNFLKDSLYSLVPSVQHIGGDSYNGIWYINDTTSLVLLNTITNKISWFVHDTVDETTISSNKVRSVFEDSEKNLWITTLGGGLNLFNRNDSTFSCFRHDTANAESIGSDRLASIVEDSRGIIWISSPDGLLIRFDRKTGKFENIRIEDPLLFFWNSINSPVLCIDGNDNIWIGGQRNLYMYDQKNGNITAVPIEISIGTRFTNISSICEAQPNLILVSTSHSGLYIYHSNTGAIENYTYNPSAPYGINSNRLSCILKSRDGVVWISSYDNGVNLYSYKTQRFSQLLHYVDYEKSEYAGYSTFSLCELPDGKILIGTENNGILEYEPGKNAIKRILPELANVSVFDLQLEGNMVWVSTWINGFYRYDFQKKILTPVSHIHGLKIQSWQMPVHFLHDSKNRYWLGGITTGLTMIDAEKGRTHYFYYIDKDSTSLLDNTVYRIFEDGYGHIWIGTSKGLHLYDDIRNSFKRIIFSDASGKPVASGVMVMDIFEDQKKQLWVGSSRTLHQLNRRTLKTKAFSHKNKGIYLSVAKIFEDNKQHLWLATNYGIYRFNSETAQFKEYSVSDGLDYLGNNPNAGLKSSNGFIYIGHSKGVTIFKPENIKDDTIPPPVYITAVSVNDVEIDLHQNEPGDIHMTHVDKIRLNYKQTTIEIHFAAIDYNNTEANEYKYMLVGIDDDWVYAGNKNIAYYPNLTPGKYTFKVIASNSHGYWNETGQHIHFNIRPPLWKQWWFRIFLAMFILAMVFSRIISLKRKEVRLEKLVKDRTKELNQANIELKEHHEELRQKHEEISAQNEQLSQLSEEILRQNIQLEQHHTQLEKLVATRTQELRLALKQSKESDRLKSAFLANMSHEIRTPMNAIVGFANLLKDNDLSEADKNDFIAVINSNSETLLVLIDDILDLSLIEANQLNLKKETFSLNEMLDHLYSSYSLLNNKSELSIRLSNTLYERDLYIFSDRIRIKQVLTNLLNNAYKFTEKGYLEIGLTEYENQLSLYVKDTGIGISADDLAHIFERFRKIDSQNNASYRGTGLGLAISKALAQLLDGNLTVESVHGEGSLFRLNLPWSVASVNENKVETKSSVIGTQKWEGHDILIVEDEKANYLYAKKVLSKLEVNVHWAENGEEAIRLLSEKQNYHLILMDIKMPVLDGFEATRIIKEKNPHQVVIALTAYARPEDRLRFMDAGFDDYLSKPITPNDLLGVISRYI